MYKPVVRLLQQLLRQPGSKLQLLWRRGTRQLLRVSRSRTSAIPTTSRRLARSPCWKLWRNETNKEGERWLLRRLLRRLRRRRSWLPTSLPNTLPTQRSDVLLWQSRPLHLASRRRVASTVATRKCSRGLPLGPLPSARMLAKLSCPLLQALFGGRTATRDLARNSWQGPA